jgi:hypothetical protein
MAQPVTLTDSVLMPDLITPTTRTNFHFKVTKRKDKFPAHVRQKLANLKKQHKLHAAVVSAWDTVREATRRPSCCYF